MALGESKCCKGSPSSLLQQSGITGRLPGSPALGSAAGRQSAPRVLCLFGPAVSERGALPRLTGEEGFGWLKRG